MRGECEEQWEQPSELASLSCAAYPPSTHFRIVAASVRIFLCGEISMVAVVDSQTLLEHGCESGRA